MKKKRQPRAYAIGIPKVAHARVESAEATNAGTPCIVHAAESIRRGACCLCWMRRKLLGKHYGAAEIVADDIGHTRKPVYTTGMWASPVILLAGGLGNSARASFADLDISRFKGGCEMQSWATFPGSGGSCYP